MSYSLTKLLPSCTVERKLLLELEEYVRRKTAEFARLDDPLTKQHYQFIVVDGSGAETLKSVEDYKRAYFPDDTARMKLEAACKGKDSISIGIILAVEKPLSQLEIQYDGNSAREVATGIASEINSIMESYKNSHKWFHLFPGTITILLLFAILAITFSIDKSILANVPAVGSVILGAVTVLVVLHVLPLLVPYSTFETRRNERRKKQINWILLGALGFILFTVIGVYFRKRLFGF
jgi:hypothetical protein